MIFDDFANREYLSQINSSTIDGNVEFVSLSVQFYSVVTSVNSVFSCPTKSLIIVIIVE